VLYRKSEAKAYAKAHMRGIWAAIPYPFTADGELDEEGLRRDIRRYIDGLGIAGFFCGGLVGEFWSLTLEERKRAQAIVVDEVAGRAQTMPHTGALGLRDTIALTRHAQEIGATYAVVANPAMSSRDPEDIHEYFRALASEVDIGISLFNTPLCGYCLSPEQIARLAEIENVFCIKNPQSPEHTQEVRRLTAGSIIVCDPSESRWLDNLVVHKDPVFMSSPDPYLLQTPAKPRMNEYTQLARAGELEAARSVWRELEPVRRVADRWMNAVWSAPGVPIAAIKYWSELLGFTGGAPRAPVRPLREEQKQALRRDLAAAGLLG
jgi:4-hydroxy-tetrahydrodipicolinate synthase